MDVRVSICIGIDVEQYDVQSMTFKVHFNSRATRADLSAPRYVEFLLNSGSDHTRYVVKVKLKPMV